MKSSIILAVAFVGIIASTGRVIAQTASAPIPPMTDEEKRISVLINAGKYPPPPTAEQWAAYGRLRAEINESLTNARKARRERRYEDAIKIYRSLPREECRINEWELAQVYAESGDTQKAIAQYRSALYQKVRFAPQNGIMFDGFILSPRATLPGDAVSIEDAKERFSEEEVEVWANNDPTILGRFALLLAQTGEYAEAIGVYEYALKQVGNDDWQSILPLGNLSVKNFDSRRFEASVYAMMAAKDSFPVWMEFQYGKVTGAEYLRNYNSERYAWINEALRVKPDFAPALYIKAALITTMGDTKTDAEYRVAKVCLDQAEQYARNGELRELVQKLRRDQSSRLR